MDFAASHPLPTRNMVIVEFPGNVINDSAALESFGGEDGLSTALAATGTMLPLRFRPKDPLSHPVFGDHTSTTSLVLKVTTKITRESPVEGVQGQHGKRQRSSEAQSTTRTEVKTEVVGKASNMYRFSGLADFQFVDHAGAMKKRRMEAQGADDDGEEFDLHVDVGKILDEQADEELQLVPPIFSKIDDPQDYNFKQTPNYSLIYTKAADGTSTQRRVALTKRQVKYTISARWGQAVPQRMSDLALKNSALLASHQEGIAVLQGMFADRPVWSHLALRNSLPPPQQFAFKSLCFVAYTVANGPFRTLWVRFGFDPKREPAARRYQLFDFRMPSDVYLRLKDKAPPPPAGGRAGGPQPFRRKVVTAGDGGAAAGRGGDGGGGGNEEEEGEGAGGARRGGEEGEGAGGGAGLDDHTFSSPPSKMQTLYQLADIRDPYVEGLVAEAAPEAVCGERFGWFRRETMAAIAQRLQMRLRALTGIGIGVAERGALGMPPGAMALLHPAKSNSGHKAASDEEERAGRKRGEGEREKQGAGTRQADQAGEGGGEKVEGEEAAEAEAEASPKAAQEEAASRGGEGEDRVKGRAEELVEQLQSRESREEVAPPTLARDSSSLRGASLQAVIGSGLGVLAQRIDSGRFVGQEEIQDFDLLEGDSSDEEEEDGDEDGEEEDAEEGEDGSGYDS